MLRLSVTTTGLLSYTSGSVLFWFFGISSFRPCSIASTIEFKCGKFQRVWQKANLRHLPETQQNDIPCKGKSSEVKRFAFDWKSRETGFKCISVSSVMSKEVISYNPELWKGTKVMTISREAWSSIHTICPRLGLKPHSVENRWSVPKVVSSNLTLVRVFLCPSCVGSFLWVALTLR